MATLRLALILLTACGLRASESAASQLAAEREECYVAHRDQLHQLAQWCQSKGLRDQAELTRNWLPERSPLIVYIFALPDSSAPPADLVDSDAAHQWWERFAMLRRSQADALFALAESAIEQKQPALAMELARETVRENPNHERARAALGYEQIDNRWITPEATRRLRAGQAWSGKYGWLPAEYLPRYESGQRYDRGRWIDAEEDARLHADIRNGWRVESDNFAVTTNHSLEEGVRLAEQLEALYEAWRQVFCGFYASAGDVARWFKSGQPQPSGPARRLFQVVYFRNKQQYADALRTAQPQIDISVGTYLDGTRTAYFFAGDQQHPGTLLHEATHQLFRESRSGSVDPGRKNNFWIVEAVACYMESFAEHQPLPGEAYGRFYTVGGANEGRVPAARKRLLEDNFYVPLRELAALGMVNLQRDPRIAPLYSQSAGLALFLMHADGGRYRQPLMDYLIAVYSGRASPETLEKLAGARYEELDQQYREFMQ